MKNIISWMVDNHVTSNLIMLMIIFIGLFSMTTLKQEIFPEVEIEQVTIEIIYRGASPDEIESSVVQRVEEAISGIDGVRELSGIASEGIGIVNVEIEYGGDVNLIKDRIQTEIDRLTTLPENAEKPVVKIPTQKSEVIQLAISGNIDEYTHTKITEQIKDELLELPQISQVGMSGVKNYELVIEVSKNKLSEYGLQIEQISAAIKRGSMDLPGGKLLTKNGDILLRTKALGLSKEDYEDIIIKTTPLGNTVKIKDIAVVKDGFEDSDLYSQFDSKPAKLITVYRTGDEGAIDVAEAVKKYIKEKEKSMPTGVNISYWQDMSLLLKSRIDLLTRNALIGLILVIVSLTLFLDIRLSLWVSIGIVISFLGSFAVMKLTGTSINMISLFGFIIVLGIVVDDAIVVSENIMTFRNKGFNSIKAAKTGTFNVSTPVIYAVLTTVAAFAPLAFVDGLMGKIMAVIPTVVISVLAFSLYESLMILPSHLSHLKPMDKTNKFVKFFGEKSQKMDKHLWIFIEQKFTPFLKKCLKNRYTTIAVSILILLFCVGMFRGGFINFTFMPSVEAENMYARLQMPTGTSFEQTLEVIKYIEDAAANIEKEFIDRTENNKVYEHVFSIVGEQPGLRRGPLGGGSVINPAIAEINIELVSSDDRKFSTTEMMNRWREKTGEITGIKSLNFVSSLMHAGNDIEFQLSSANTQELNQAVNWVKQNLSSYSGVSDIKDDLEEGKYELKFKLKPEANSLGLTLFDLAKQVRQGFYGDEVMRIQRGRDEVKIVVRYPKEEKNSLGDIENMMIRTMTGTEIPFTDVAEVEFGRGYSAISRLNRARIISIIADVDEDVANANDINQDLMMKIKKELKENFSSVSLSKGGAQKEQKRSMISLAKGFIIALFIIYLLLAIPFKSYSQPIIVMTAIPFGIVGAIIGHLIMGYTLSFVSALGIVALSGVVVNDSLVLVDFVNVQNRKNGLSIYDSVISAAQRRFRPIMLTSLTTFLGLMPMILEKSLQARFLVPMAISLGFGIIFATAITLIFVPTSVLIMDDFKKIAERKSSKKVVNNEA
ncbi:MAG: efflux RND transporter permease subunit [Candidatus Cloacimonetes bacterium]|nr:efflux RND transporter permease subunit [Candidatus Cloacimonadota bacterium]